MKILVRLLRVFSSDHWPLLVLFHAFFVHWSITPNKLTTSPTPLTSPISSAQTIGIFSQKCFSCAKSASKVIAPPKKMLLPFSIGTFLTNCDSQIESTTSTQYTPFYENEQFESQISQWRLLKFTWERFDLGDNCLNGTKTNVTLEKNVEIFNINGELYFSEK